MVRLELLVRSETPVNQEKMEVLDSLENVVYRAWPEKMDNQVPRVNEGYQAQWVPVVLLELVVRLGALEHKDK